MTGHYSLDVHPEDLRATAATLGELSAHLRTKAARVAATPGEIGSRWQGQAATSVKENMAALGQQMNRFDDKFHDASQALKTLAAYLDRGGNYDETARALSVHRNTLRYRLARITKISGHDLTEVDTRLNLHLAARAWMERHQAPGQS